MNHSTPNITFQACKCPNQHLLETGEICEICMGIVERTSFLDDYLPYWTWGIVAYLWNGIEDEAPKVEAELDPFDELYFEELESYYDDIDYAA